MLDLLPTTTHKVILAGPFSFGNQRMKMNIMKKGTNRRPRNMYMDQVPGRNQMASMPIAVMTQMVILVERTQKQRRLASLMQ